MTERMEAMGLFQSTLSVGRATMAVELRTPSYDISIHALRGESDALIVCISWQSSISIHALRGESDSKHIQNAAWRFG